MFSCFHHVVVLGKPSRLACEVPNMHDCRSLRKNNHIPTLPLDGPLAIVGHCSQHKRYDSIRLNCICEFHGIFNAGMVVFIAISMVVQ
ncbi:unnamed protein product [Cuscuta campestris]|uniref:Uncharacterized protein n=1 Tax=Cuscuta campestris TaxID=132261 RepID=A0A484MA15_9ASTE|nr:unnamed protein product [Cuscuta campestris]